MGAQDAALTKMRKICLALPDTSEGEHHGEASFKVKGKMFATCGEKQGVHRIVLGLEPEHAAALLERDPRFTRYARDARGVQVDTAGFRDWKLLAELLKESYALVAPRPKPAKKAAKKAAKPARAKK